MRTYGLPCLNAGPVRILDAGTTSTLRREPCASATCSLRINRMARTVEKQIAGRQGCGVNDTLSPAALDHSTVMSGGCFHCPHQWNGRTVGNGFSKSVATGALQRHSNLRISTLSEKRQLEHDTSPAEWANSKGVKFQPSLNGFSPVSKRPMSNPLSWASVQAPPIAFSDPFLRGTGRRLYSVLRPLPSLPRTKSCSSRLA